MGGKIKEVHSEKRGNAALRHAQRLIRRAADTAWRRCFLPFWAMITKLRKLTQNRIELASTLILVIYLPLLVVHTVTHAQLAAVSTPRVFVRTLGDPERALERIVEENFTTIDHLNELATDEDNSELTRMIYANTPLILRQAGPFPERYNTPIGLYYDVSQSTSGSATATTIRYFLWFTDEDGGMEINRRLAKFGHSMDRELVYRVTFLGDRIVSAYYQAPGHQHVKFDYQGDARPIFTVASSNHNFRLIPDLDLERYEYGMLVPLPHRESADVPAHDPDFAALAAREVWWKYSIDLRNFVFVELNLPVYSAVATISVRINDRWYYLHEQIGDGVSRPGYNQVAINVGYPVLRGDISEVRVVSYSDQDVDFDRMHVSIYPPSAVIA